MLSVPPGLLTRAAACAARADTDGHLDPGVVDGVRSAGFARHFVPRENGGRSGGFAELGRAAAELAGACTSAAWCATLFAAHARLASYLPGAGRAELWSGSPDVLIAASVMPPQGTATPDRDGWRLDGVWNYASGVEWADWVLLAALTGVGEHRVLAVPAAEVKVENTWDALGLRATGSHSVVAGDVWVPAHRTFTLADLARPPAPGTARCHAVPYLLVASLMFAAPVLGAARATVDEALAGPPSAPGSGAERALGLAAGRVEAAGLLIGQAAARADGTTAGKQPGALEVGLNRRDVTLAAQLCQEACDALLAAAGTQGVRAGSGQRRWRDVMTAVRHPMLAPDAGAAAWVQAVSEHRRR